MDVLLRGIILWVVVACVSIQADKSSLKGDSPATVANADIRQQVLGQILINEEHKFAFCPIEKVASTQFKQLFYRISGDDLWFEPPYHKPRIPTLMDLGKERAQAVLEDPSWIKAVIFRDPAKRMISSYLHLVLNPGTPSRYRDYLRENQRNVSWDSFVRAIVGGKKGWRNPHWDPQSSFCGLNKFWKYFNFVGNYEDIQTHGEILNRAVGILNYTSDGWSIVRRFKSPVLKGFTPAMRRKKYIRENKLLTSNRTGDCMWCKNRAHHQNNYTVTPIASLLTIDTWKTIKNSLFYVKDYELFSQITASPFNSSLYTQCPL